MRRWLGSVESHSSLPGSRSKATGLLILSALATAYPHNTNKAACVFEVAMVFIVGLTYCWSDGPITPAIASEIFPQEVRDEALGLSLPGETGCLLALTQPWPRFNQEVGLQELLVVIWAECPWAGRIVLNTSILLCCDGKLMLYIDLCDYDLAGDERDLAGEDGQDSWRGGCGSSWRE